MPRLIDADALLEKVVPHGWSTSLWVSDIVIKDAPTVDAVEVVRCQYCKQWEYDAIFNDGWCRGRHQGDPNWFCADGKRKEEEADV